MSAPLLAAHDVVRIIGYRTILDGVSLTVAELDAEGFAVALVPHTLAATTLGELEPGRQVNLEADVLAKYVERLVAR